MITTAMITAAATYAVNEIKNSKGGQQAADELSTGIWGWIRPIFLKDEKKLVEKLEENPEKFQTALELKIEEKAEEDEGFAEKLTTLLKEAAAKGIKSNTTTITGNDNQVFQDVSNSKISIDKSVTQTHSGTGDNVGKNKIINK